MNELEKYLLEKLGKVLNFFVEKPFTEAEVKNIFTYFKWFLTGLLIPLSKKILDSWQKNRKLKKWLDEGVVKENLEKDVKYYVPSRCSIRPPVESRAHLSEYHHRSEDMHEKFERSDTTMYNKLLSRFLRKWHSKNKFISYRSL